MARIAHLGALRDNVLEPKWQITACLHADKHDCNHLARNSRILICKFVVVFRIGLHLLPRCRWLNLGSIIW